MTAPMPLAEAVRICFPFGGVTKSTLLAAIRLGVLEFERIGRGGNGPIGELMAWKGNGRERLERHKIRPAAERNQNFTLVR